MIRWFKDFLLINKESLQIFSKNKHIVELVEDNIKVIENIIYCLERKK